MVPLLPCTRLRGEVWYPTVWYCTVCTVRPRVWYGMVWYGMYCEAQGYKGSGLVGPGTAE